MLDVVLVEVEEDEVEIRVVDVDAVVTEVELDEVEEDEAETLVVEVDAVAHRGASVLQNPRSSPCRTPQVTTRIEGEALGMIQTRRGGTEYRSRGTAREVRLADHEARGLTGGERTGYCPGKFLLSVSEIHRLPLESNVSASGASTPVEVVTVLLFGEGVYGRSQGSRPRRSDGATSAGLCVHRRPRGVPAGNWTTTIEGGIQSFLADLIVDRREVRLTDDEAEAASWVENGAAYSRTLSLSRSATQRFPLESNARP